MTETRKLAAILAADVAGYSRLAAADEERTLARLRALRSDLIDPTIAVHHGRVVKRSGDGSIVELPPYFIIAALPAKVERRPVVLERDLCPAAGHTEGERMRVVLGDEQHGAPI
jgi:adenylate cyclase